MALQAGTRLGPYEILAPLGAGGMGEVYRARDTRLGRDVAVKVLPQHVTASPEERARFKREAKTISSLNHPHICTLHDVGQDGDTDYLVMELVEGETLAQRIARGALPTSDVLRTGAQIADALNRAHRAGIVHRDLKPGNVMLTKSGAKLMDFGLARAGAGDAHGARAVGAATATAPVGASHSEEPITAKGTVVGTFQYMAPEQLEGKNADARTDIWALGCVLYEMATGKRAFEGSTPASLISAIMRDQPREMAELAPMAPPAFERAVRQCLEKDPDDRWQSAGDLNRELSWIAEAGSQAGAPAPVAARRRWRERVAWALVAITLAGLATVLLQPKPAPKPVTFELTPPARLREVDLPRISPDGTTLAFNATDSAGVSSIWVRPMSSLGVSRLQGTEGALRPFWSPDSRNIAYFAGSKLWKIAMGGGPPVALCDAPRGGDGTWSSRGVILFDGASGDSVQMVSAAGGTPTGAGRLDRAHGETSSAWPQFLPDGRHFLYIAYDQDSDSGTLKVGSIGSKATTSLGPARSRFEYASGHLLYVSGGTLIGRPFDPSGLTFTGEPVAVAQGVEADLEGGADFSASSEGTLVFHSGASPAPTRLVWLDRRGKRQGTVGTPGDYDMPALSPDGTRLAVRVTEPSGSGWDLWLWDLPRNQGSRYTFANVFHWGAAWSPDGGQLAYARDTGGGARDIFVKPVGHAGAESLLVASNGAKGVYDWSRDGAWILYAENPPSALADIDIYAVALADLGRPVPIVTTKDRDVHAALSPDGKWLAYASRESGLWEVYVQPFREPGPRSRISTHGGVQPFWRGDGREIFYLALDGGLMSVAVEPGTPPQFSPLRKLFDAPGGTRLNTRNQYVPTRDGQRFLFVAPEGEPKVGATTVMLNWPAMLPKR